MKILLFTQTFPLNPNDGTAHFMSDLASGFVQNGHQVTVLVPFHLKLCPQAFPKIRVIAFRYIWPPQLHLLGFGRTLVNDQKLKWYAWLLAPFYFLFGSLSLYKIIKKEKIDVISSHWVLPNGVIAALVTRLTKTPFMVTLPGSDVFLSRRNILFKLLANFAKKNAAALVSDSPQLLRDFGGLGTVIPYPVPANRGQRSPNLGLKIVAAGRLVEKKGFSALPDIPEKVEVLSDLPIDSFRQKLLSVDIFLSLSQRDSRGNLDDTPVTLLEAMSAGCAVITTKLPGNRNLIQNGENGLIVNTSGPTAITGAIEKLKRSAKLRRRLGQAARQTIIRLYTPTKIAKRYLEIFGTAITR